jgi:hypothetical protein
VGNPYPSHTCTVSPFESYHSNVVNRLNRLVSNNEDCIFSSDKINATITSGSEVTLSSGSVFKDDVFITIEDFIVDFSDADYYYYGTIWDEIGYYYILLYYVYEKTRPAPKPRIQILKPSERTTYVPDGDFVLIKVAKVECVTTFQVTQLLDFDPDNPTVRRIYSKTYIGLEDEKPVFDVNHDPGRLLLTTDDDILQYGGSVDWITIPSMALIDAQFVNLYLSIKTLEHSLFPVPFLPIIPIMANLNLQ